MNAHFLYQEITGKKITLLQFREAVVDKLLEKNETDDLQTPQNKSVLQKHVFQKLPGSAREGRKYCKGCYGKKIKNEIPKSKVRKVTTFCNDCEFQPRYCLDCFNAKHKN